MASLSFTMLMLGIAAVLALILGAVGLYGVLSYRVTRRTREIGVRMALGAEAHTVRRMVVAQGGRVALLGVAIRRSRGSDTHAVHQEPALRCRASGRSQLRGGVGRDGRRRAPRQLPAGTPRLAGGSGDRAAVGIGERNFQTVQLVSSHVPSDLPAHDSFERRTAHENCAPHRSRHPRESGDPFTSSSPRKRRPMLAGRNMGRRFRGDDSWCTMQFLTPPSHGGFTLRIRVILFLAAMTLACGCFRGWPPRGGRSCSRRTSSRRWKSWRTQCC